MDEFKYALYVEKLLSLKYAKDLEEEIRILYSNPLCRYYHEYGSKVILTYKIYALAMKLFKEKSKKVLPDKFYAYRINFQKGFHKKLFRKDEEILKYLKFDNYISIFEYDDLVYLPAIQGDQSKLHDIIGNRKLPFKYEYIDVHPTNFEAYSYTKDAKISNFVKSTIANIANQISLSNGRDSTFLKIEFDQHKNKFNSSLTSEEIDQLKASIKRLDLHKQAILEAIELFGGQNVH